MIEFIGAFLIVLLGLWALFAAISWIAENFSGAFGMALLFTLWLFLIVYLEKGK